MMYDYRHLPSAPRRIAIGYPNDEQTGFIAYAHFNGDRLSPYDFQHLVRINHEILLIQGRQPEMEFRIIPQRACLFMLPKQAESRVQFVGVANRETRPTGFQAAYNQHLIVAYPDHTDNLNVVAYLNGEYLEASLFERWVRVVMETLVHLHKTELNLYLMHTDHPMYQTIFYFDDQGLVNPKTGVEKQ